MAIQVPADLEAAIRQKVASGHYDDPAAVVRDALRALEERDRLRSLRASVAEGFAAIERGEGVELTPEVMAEIGREAEERFQRGEQPHPDVCP